MSELSTIQNIAIMAIPLIFAITLHEVAHGWMALYFGDHTAKLAGRLSFNPIKHIDPIGTVALPLLMLTFTNFIFGWAKPVPVDSRNMRHPRRDSAIVALAGPLSNLLMALMWAAAAKLGFWLIHSGNTWWGTPLSLMGEAGIMLNVILGVLNLIPLPPLDGGRVLMSLLPPRLGYQLSLIEPYSFFILILLLVTGLLTAIIQPIYYFVVGVISMLFGM